MYVICVQNSKEHPRLIGHVLPIMLVVGYGGRRVAYRPADYHPLGGGTAGPLQFTI